MTILGISCYYHDAAAALIQDGQIVAAAEEERFSRKKHDSSFPRLAIDFCLKTNKITPAELDYVVFYEKPFRKFHRILISSFSTYPRSYALFREAIRLWLTQKLWIKQEIASYLTIDPKKILFSEHHLSHAASCFYPSPFEKAAILTVDGVGEWTTASYSIGEDDKITILKELYYPQSLGLLYSAFTAFLGFEVNEGEWKVMGLSPYGKPRYADRVWKVVRKLPDGSFSLDFSYFSFQYSDKTTFSSKFVDLFGEPIPPKESHLVTERSADLAASIQKVTEELLLSMVKNLKKKTGLENLCLSGGVALNSVANYKILKEGGFKNIYIQPAAGDSGGALGAALYAYHYVLNTQKESKNYHHTSFLNAHDTRNKIFSRSNVKFSKRTHGSLYQDNGKDIVENNKRNFPGSTDMEPPSFVSEKILHTSEKEINNRYLLTTAYLGQQWNNEAIEQFLKDQNIKYKKLSEEKLVDFAAEEISKGKVIGWMQGRFEWGPRALGNRSILADPRNPKMKDIINAKVKFREAFRPFAPSVLADHAHEVFNLSSSFTLHTSHFTLNDHYPLRFMLYVVPVKKSWRKKVPAITHADNTARPQLVYKQDNPLYYKLISAFYKKTGVPLVLNTSFNLRGEPIVSSPHDAYSTYQRSGIDILVMGNYLCEKKKGGT